MRAVKLLAVEIILARKASNATSRIAIEFVAHDIEIVAAATDGKIGRPPTLTRSYST